MATWLNGELASSGASQASVTAISTDMGDPSDAGSLALLASLFALARKGAKESWETEHHFHNGDLGFGVAAVPAAETHAADRTGTGAAGAEAAPFVLDAGNDDWGTWTLLIGSSDTPPAEIPTATHFDFNELTIVDTEADDQRYMYQFVFQNTAPVDDPGSSDTFTEGEFFIHAAALFGDPVLPTRVFRAYRRTVGTKVWGRLRAPNLNTSTASFYLYGHYYIDPDV